MTRAQRLAAKSQTELHAQLEACTQIAGEIIWEMTDRACLETPRTLALIDGACNDIKHFARKGPSTKPEYDEASAYEALEAVDSAIAEALNRPQILPVRRVLERIQTKSRVALLTCMEAGSLPNDL